jgi:hypothetical protein
VCAKAWVQIRLKETKKDTVTDNWVNGFAFLGSCLVLFSQEELDCQPPPCEPRQRENGETVDEAPFGPTLDAYFSPRDIGQGDEGG